MTSRVKVRRYFYGLTIEANNFALEVKVRLGFEKDRPDSKVDELELNGLHD